MDKNLFFNFTSTNGVGRKEPLHLENFLNDLKDVYEKHNVTSVKNGFTGFHLDGKFGITNADIDLSEK